MIETLREDLEGAADAQVLSCKLESDPTLLKFGMESVMALVGVLKGVYAVGEFASKIYKTLKEKDRRIVVQTPFGRYEFVPNKKLTLKETQGILSRLISAQQ